MAGMAGEAGATFGHLFTEWLELAAPASSASSRRSPGASPEGAGVARLKNIITAATPAPLSEKDALIVIDMQRDFVPVSVNNVEGGLFGVAEGDEVVAPICSLIKAASEVGATIIASRDYHPHDHCSFAHMGGHFPSHCVQGTNGSKFLPEIAEALELAMRVHPKGPDHVLIAFKAMHEHVDSFGALPYCKEPFGSGRVAKAEEAEQQGSNHAAFSEFGKVMGCAKAPWTGSLILKQSAIACAAHSEDGHEEVFDADAPPDVLAVLQDGVDRKLRTMQDAIAQHMCPEEGRIFVCGLALDFCVHDTCVNATALWSGACVERVFVCIDASRAAHIPGLGTFGSGFLSDPDKVRTSLTDSGVAIVATSDVLPKGYAVPRPIREVHRFPAALGPLSLKTAHSLTIRLVPETTSRGVALDGHSGGTYTLALEGVLKPFGLLPDFSNEGVLSPRVPLPRGWPRSAVGSPATHLCWASPMQGIRNLSFQAVGKHFLAITARPALMFVAYGGFLLLDEQGDVVEAQAVREGSAAGAGLSVRFQDPIAWKSAEFLGPLKDAHRMQNVTISALRARGAERFAWVGPDESLQSKSGVSWSPSATGGFLYQFTGGDCVFFPLAEIANSKTDELDGDA